jgi:hypothetical protein
MPDGDPDTGRRQTLMQLVGVMSLVRGEVARAEAKSKPLTPKMEGISDQELSQIVRADVVERQFLVSADITRAIYDETATFTDEIDTYTMDKWVKGTKLLFVAEGSHVDLVGDVEVSPTEVLFRFSEKLMFRIPFTPVVDLTGKVVLKRDPSTGLITSYREFWDQDIVTVLKSAQF